MKHFSKKLISLVLAVLLIAAALMPCISAAVDHQKYWPLQAAYNDALKSGKPAAILDACEAIIAFYRGLEDKTACDRVTTPIQKAKAIYEEQGRQDDVLRLMRVEYRVYLRRCELTGTAPDPHQKYWILQKAYNYAITSGDTNAILDACEDIIAFYRDPWDVTACNRIAATIQKALQIYEEQGRAADVARLQEEDQRVYLLRCELTGEPVDPHRPYWILQKAHNTAMASGNPDAIAAACEDIIAFYHDLWDETACNRVISPILQTAKIYEEQGCFDDAYRLYQEYQRTYLRLGELTGDYDEQSLLYAEAMLDAYAYTDPEIYVHAANPADVPYYGAKNEPVAGTYIGMCGYYEEGLCNAHLLYTRFETETIRGFSYLLPETDDRYMLEVAWNIDDKYTENGAIEYLSAIADGRHDAYIIADLQYLNTLDVGGVLLRFGAEVNVWDVNTVYYKNGRLEEFKTVFKAAFRHIYELVQIYSPDAAMVYSPNDISNMYVTHADFYPGDDCVDWVGISAYGNQSQNSTGQFGSLNDAYYKRGVYTNQMVKIKDIVDTYGDRKPIMISECGFMYRSDHSKQDEDFAAERMQYFYSYINMLYPQIKAVFYFNNNYSGNDYCLFGEKEHSDRLAALYRQSVDGNLPMTELLDGTQSGYTRLSTLNEKREDLTLSLYAAYPGNPTMHVTCTLDGKTVGTTKTVPYTVHIGADRLGEGRHTLSVTLQVQATTVVKEYVVYVSSDGTIRAAAPDMTDVPQNWSYSYISYCMQEGFFEGLVGTAFSPTKNVTRAEFVTLLGRAAGIDPADYSAPDFTDVDADAYCAPYVTWAKEAGVTAGTGDGTTFSPDMVITREQICTMLVRYCDKAGIVLPEADDAEFADDAEIDEWYRDGVYRAKTAGIVSGKGGNRFDPNAELTRQEIAVILKNFHLGFIRENKQ